MTEVSRRAFLQAAIVAAPVVAVASAHADSDIDAPGTVDRAAPARDTIVKTVVSRRYYKVGYEVRRELCSFDIDPENPIEMRSGYTPSGDYLGDAKTARFLYVKRGIRFCERRTPTSSVCSIGFQPQEQKWYGWSHRAICGFGLGDHLFVEDYGDDHTNYKEHGPETITTLVEAKLSASRFAASVS